ncbi:hypothetical protein SteCoe_27800 [Stentor coeruleus]|uniref:SAM domain-containing protein n=1 Tax=Stentor coeruleus TaxID=5963 RepID=A0A1R2BA75_9CILI|nr:hypothetical protein SteCoe_27800 [Stentor coeruleus]
MLKKKINPANDVLQEEAKRMEEKLSELKEFMQKEKEKRNQEPKLKDLSRLRINPSNKLLINNTEPKPKTQDEALQLKKNEYIPTSTLLESPINNPYQQNQLFDFLSNCGMEKYYKSFIDNGIEDLEILLELTEPHLVNMKIPLGHRLKILKKIRDLKALTLNTNLIKNSTKHPSSTTISENESTTPSKTPENDSYNMFKEAIEQFNNPSNPTKHKSKTNIKSSQDSYKNMPFLEPITEEMLPKETKGLLYEGTWITNITQQPKTTDESSDIGSLKLIKEPKSCWNCYKLVSGENVCKAYDKDFCSDTCVMVYYESHIVKCSCGKKFIKTDGFVVNKIWVCSDLCADILGQSKEGYDYVDI